MVIISEEKISGGHGDYSQLKNQLGFIKVTVDKL